MASASEAIQDIVNIATECRIKAGEATYPKDEELRMIGRLAEIVGLMLEGAYDEVED